VARFTEEDAGRLLLNPGIIRNRAKIAATIGNARAFLRVQEEFGSFARYMWNFVDGRPIVNTWQAMSEVPTRTPVSDAFSKDLIGRGFRFVGPVICYSHMKAVGMVNDHLVECFRHSEVDSHRPCA
jgi:DNA-3-methyladenine glycosylase I